MTVRLNAFENADELRLHFLKFFECGYEEVIGKARDLMNPVLGAGQTTKLIDAIMASENLKNIRELRPLLQRG